MANPVNNESMVERPIREGEGVEGHAATGAETHVATPTALGFDTTGWVGLAALVVVFIMLWKKVPAMIGRGLVHIQQYSIARLRPEDPEKLVNVTNPSFPSGHSASS